jgi:PHP family Zn ribbon phosphoesterase
MEFILKTPPRFSRVKQLDCLYFPTEIFVPHDSIIIDLSRLKSIRPFAVIAIINTIAHLSFFLPMLQIKIIPPLVRVDFIKTLEMFREWRIPEEDRRTIGAKLNPFIPLRHFKKSQDVEDIAKSMEHTFHTELLGISTLLQPCHVIFSELADNVLHHAGSNGGFILAQQFNFSAGSILEIAIGDIGIGISASLKKKESLTNRFSHDKDAIELALEDGISCIADDYRGYGLGHVNNEVTRAKDRILTFRSGNGYIIRKGDGYKYKGICKCLPGTIAHVIIPCK